MSKRRRSTTIRAVWAIPILAAITVTLGTWGWMSHGLDFDSGLYQAIGLFNNANDNYIQAPALGDWRFRIARWTGVVVLFSTVLLAIGTLLQQRVSTTLARRTKQSVVVIGGDALATAAFEAAQQTAPSSLWLGAPAFDSKDLRTIALPWPPQERAQAVIDYAGRSD